MDGSRYIERIVPKDKHVVRRVDNAKPKDKDNHRIRKLKRQIKENVWDEK
jgi:hypothetical protein